MEDHRSKQQPSQQQQQPLNWQPRPVPVAFPGYQMPLRPLPPQMFVQQPMPYYQPDYAGAYETMLGGYPPPYYAQQFPTTMTNPQQPQQQQHQQQQQQQIPVDYQSCYGSYGPAVAAALQSSYPQLPAAFLGNAGSAPPQWSPAPPWPLSPAGDGFGQAEPSGRSPNKMRFGGGTGQGAGRGWKRNRDGSFNNKRPGVWQRNEHFQGSANRPGLRCEPCDRNFVGRNQMDAHMKTHMKCNIDGCLFEGIGKAVSEHRQTVHFKKPAMSISKETEEETKRWREARRKNFPTTANLERKLQAMQARAERGELVDEDALMRQESLKQILAKQAELGCQVAEVPPYYLSQRYTSRPLKVPRTSEDLEGSKAFHGGRKQGRKVCVFFQKGHCKKGRRCHFLHDANASNKDNGKTYHRNETTNNVKAESATKEREPTLLSKLLSAEINRDKSHLLQCFRFFVNNKFLVDYPETPLKMFEWAESEEKTDAKALPAADDLDDEDQDEEEIHSEGKGDEELEEDEEAEEEEAGDDDYDDEEEEIDDGDQGKKQDEEEEDDECVC